MILVELCEGGTLLGALRIYKDSYVTAHLNNFALQVRSIALTVARA